MTHDESSNPSKTFSLNVKEMYTMGRHHGVARLHRDLLSAMGLNNGDMVELRGKKRTYAKIHELYPTDQGKGIVRLDEIQRASLAVGIGDSVSVLAVERKIPAAESVVVVPLVRDASRLMSDALIPQLNSIPVTKGDFMAAWHFLESIVFKVIDVHPLSANQSDTDENPVAIITKDTKLIIQPVDHQQEILKFETGQVRPSKGPINITVYAYGIVEDSSEGDQEPTNRSINHQAIVLTLELTLSTARFVNTTRTFRRLVSPSERPKSIIDMCMNAAINIVDEANAKLSTSVEDEITRHNNSKMNDLVQTVFNTANRIISKWIVVAEEKPEKNGTG